MVLFYLGFVIFFFGTAFHLMTKKYLNPYKLYLIFGKKGSGKSTLLTKIALQHLKQGRQVFTTEYIPGTYQIDINMIGEYAFPPGSVLLVDEVGMKWDNRKYKEFKDCHRDFFKLQRHYNLIVYLFSQTFDVDKKIRDLTDNMYLCKKVLRVFSVARKIDRTIVLNRSTAERPSSIDENLQFVPFFLPGAFKITFIPKYTKYFDSFSTPELKHYDFQFIPCLPPSNRSDGLLSRISQVFAPLDDLDDTDVSD